MIMKSWKARAKEAEAENETLKLQMQQFIATTQAALDAMKARPQIVGITQSGRVNRFTFLIADQQFVIETMGTWDDDVDGWKKALGLGN